MIRYSSVMQIVAIVSAFAAGFVWAQSAIWQPPADAWDSLATLKPYFEQAGMLNRMAAACATLSAISNGASFVGLHLERRGHI
jgi:hypothetical protein